MSQTNSTQALLNDVARASPAGARSVVPTALLTCSALIIAALIIVQLGRMGRAPGTPDAALAAIPLTLGMNADVVAQAGEFTMLSFNAGSDDVLAVLDSRGEQLFAYRIENQREFKLIERQSLPEVFAKAKAMRK